MTAMSLQLKGQEHTSLLRFVCPSVCEREADSQYSACVFVLFRPNRITTYVDTTYCYRLSSVVCLSVCLSAITVGPAKTAEPIEMPFGMWKLQTCIRWGVHWRHLANTIEPSMLGGDMRPFCRITWSLWLHVLTFGIGKDGCRKYPTTYRAARIRLLSHWLRTEKTAA